MKPDQEPPDDSEEKLSPPQAAALIVGGAILGWAVLVAVAWLLGRFLFR